MTDKHQNLDLKYRPRYLKDLVGQESTVKYLKHLLEKDINKNLIFTGEFGTGKTTSARIYANALLCKDKQGHDRCGKCPTCQAFDINSNRIQGYTEFDAASQGSVDNIRDKLKPFDIKQPFVKKNIWVIDEAHSMSPQAWDALLKTVEEPQPFQVILFCTNYPEKIRPAISSRCQTIELNLLDFDSSMKLAKSVISAERWDYEERALQFIINKAGGHSRDLLKLLERVTSFDGYVSDVNLIETGIKLKEYIPYNIWISLLDINSNLDDILTIIAKSLSNKNVIEEFINVYLAIKLIYTKHKDLERSSTTHYLNEEQILQLEASFQDFINKTNLSADTFFKIIDSIILLSNVTSTPLFKVMVSSIYRRSRFDTK